MRTFDLVLAGAVLHSDNQLKKRLDQREGITLVVNAVLCNLAFTCTKKLHEKLSTGENPKA